MTPPRRRLRFALGPTLLSACGAIAFALALGASAPAATPSPSAPPASAEPAPAENGLQTPDYRIETSETHWNFNSGDFTMPHRVKFYRPGTDAVSDRASGNSKKGTASLYGEVVVHDSGNTATSVGKGAYSGSGPATLTCDQLDVDSKAKLYVATGHVHFSQGTRSGSSGKAILNRANGMLHLEGDVHLSDNGSTLSAQSVDYNLNTKDVTVAGAPAVMTEPQSAPAAAAPGPRPPKQPAHKPSAKKPPANKPSPKAQPAQKNASAKMRGTPSPKPSPARPAPKARPAASPRASSPRPSPRASSSPSHPSPSPAASGQP